MNVCSGNNYINYITISLIACKTGDYMINDAKVWIELNFVTYRYRYH